MRHKEKKKYNILCSRYEQQKKKYNAYVAYRNRHHQQVLIRRIKFFIRVVIVIIAFKYNPSLVYGSPPSQRNIHMAVNNNNLFQPIPEMEISVPCESSFGITEEQLDTNELHLGAHQVTTPTFSTPMHVLRDPSRLDFKSFQKHPENAVMLFHLNRGILHFNDDDITSDYGIDCICRDIQNEIMTKAEIADRIGIYKEITDHCCALLSCGACGVRKLPSSKHLSSTHRCKSTCYKKTYLNDMDALRYTEDEVDDLHKMQEETPLCIPISDEGHERIVEPWRLLSTYIHGDMVYHLHPELVETETNGSGQERHFTHLCGTCHDVIVNQKKRPEMSIAGGVDFGNPDRIGLEPLTNMERLIISKVRYYKRIMKIKKSVGKTQWETLRLNGHSILFPHDSAEVANELLKSSDSHLEDLSEYIRIHFVGISVEEIDKIMKSAKQSSIVRGRTFVIYQWLAVLHRINRWYKDTRPPTKDELVKKLDRSYERLMSHAMKSYDGESSSYEKNIGDDTAKVRSDNIGNETFTEYSTLFDSTRKQADIVSMLKSIADIALANGSVDDGVYEEARKSRREFLPINDYREGEKALCAAFPDVFLLGKAYGEKASIKKKQREHLLFQYTTNAASNSDLIFYLYNQYTRHTNGSQMAAVIKGNRKAFDEFTNTITDDEFVSSVRNAVDDPDGSDAKRVMKRVSSFLQVSGAKTQSGSQMTCSIESHIYAMARHYGPGSVFFTIAFDDVNNPTSFRLCVRSKNNTDFPAQVDEEFLSHMVKDEAVKMGTINFPVGYVERVKQANGNPVATTALYGRLLDTLLMVLLGVEPQQCSSGFKQHTQYYLQKSHRSCKGVFGNMMAAIGVTEAQQRGTLHFHGVLFGGLSPMLLEHVSHVEKLAETISTALNTMYNASFSRDCTVQHSIHSELRSKLPSVNAPLHLAETTSYNYKRQAERMGGYLCHHEHSFTCHKEGYKECRLGFARNTCDKTKPLQLDPVFDVDGHLKDVFVLDEIDKPAQQDGISSLTNNHDDRFLMWELERPVIKELDPIPCNLEDKKGWVLQRFKPFLEKELSSTEEKNKEKFVPFQRLNDEVGTRAVEEIYKRLQSVVGSDILEDIPRGLSDSSEWILNRLRQFLLYRTMLSDRSQRAWEVLTELDEKSLVDLYGNVSSDIIERNTYVVEHNMLITSLTGSSTNAIPLGNAEQSKNTLFYLAKYLNKNKFAAKQILTTIIRAHDETMKYPIEVRSAAGEAKSEQRFAHKWMSRVLNTLDVAREISINQATAAILGHYIEMYTNSFRVVNIHGAVNWIRTQRGTDPSTDMSSMLNEPDLQLENGFNITWNQHIQFDTDQDLNIGISKIYPVQYGDGTQVHYVPVNMNMHYEFRGEKLRMLNRIEYYSLVKIVPRRKQDGDEEHDTDDQILDFGSGHPLRFHYVQELKSNQSVPVHSGKLPPVPFMKDDGTPTDMRIADRFGAYYLSAFRPEIHHFDEHNTDPSLSYNWDTFVSFWNMLHEEKKKGVFISRAREHHIDCTCNGMRLVRHAKEIYSTYRFANVDELEAHTIQTGRMRMKERRDDEHVIDDWFSCQDNDLGTKEFRSAVIVDFHTSQLRQDLGRLMSSDNDRSNGQSYITPQSVLSYDSDSCKKVLTDMKIAKEELIEHDDEHINDPYHPLARRIQMMKTKILNDEWNYTDDQKSVMTAIGDYIGRRLTHGLSAEREDNIFLITGGPGTGKSYIINTLQQCLTSIPEVQLIKTSYMGGAAVAIGGGTCCTTFNINNRGKYNNMSKWSDPNVKELDDQSLRLLQLRLNIDESESRDNFGIVVIDEISLITPEFLAHIDARLKQSTSNDLPFGGYLVLLIGDFEQLPPVASGSISLSHLAQLYAEKEITKQRRADNTNNTSTFLPTVTYKRKKNLRKGTVDKIGSQTVRKQGVQLFQKCRHWRLTEQKRCHDTTHASVLRKISDSQKISLEDLRNYKCLTPEDMQDEFKYAPFLVSTNREKHDIIHMQSIRWAKDHNSVVVRWPVRRQNWKGCPTSRDDQNSVIQSDSVFWQYFVKNGPAAITQNQFVELGTGNGTECTLHSLVLDDEQALEYEQAMEAGVKPGDIISLSDAPLYVNVRLPGDSSSNRPSLEKDETIIPLGGGKNDKFKKETVKRVVLSNGIEFHPSTVEIMNKMPFELSFAMTVHRAQGKTMDKIILVMTQHLLPICRWSLQHIYVGLSRVRLGSDIRILIPDNDKFDQHLSYVEELKGDEYSSAFFKGFSHNGSKYDPIRAYNYRLMVQTEEARYCKKRNSVNDKQKSNQSPSIRTEHRKKKRHKTGPSTASGIPLGLSRTLYKNPLPHAITEHFTTIEDVPSDGHCGFHVVADMLVSNRLLPENIKSMKDFRQHIRNFAEQHRQKLLLQSDDNFFVTHRVFSGEESFAISMNRIFDPTKPNDFYDRSVGDNDFIMATIVYPLVCVMYGINIWLYDVHDDKRSILYEWSHETETITRTDNNGIVFPITPNDNYVYILNINSSHFIRGII